MSTTDVELKDGDGVVQEYYGVESITLNGVDGTEKTFIYDDGTNTGSCSCPTGTIERLVTVTWANVTPTATFEVSEFGYTAHKISDAVLTKEQLLEAKWSLSDEGGNEVYDITVHESDIMVETDIAIMIWLSVYPGFVYVICRGTGDTTFVFNGVELTLNVPEVGIYQVWKTGQTFPTEIFGSISYIVTEEVNFVQSNWEQNDSTQPDYIKNRPFYEEDIPSRGQLIGSYEWLFTYSVEDNCWVYYSAITEEQLLQWNSDWNQLVVEIDGVE
jgi:hypothetical protein